MTISFIPIILLAVLAVCHMAVMYNRTYIGQKGRTNTFMQNIFLTAEGCLILAVCILWPEGYNSEIKICLSLLAAMGALFVFLGMGRIKRLLRESVSGISTVILTDITLSPTGYHNRAIKMEGTNNKDGSRIWFVLRGADAKWIKKFCADDTRYLTVVYYPSSQRIESISHHD